MKKFTNISMMHLHINPFLANEPTGLTKQMIFKVLMALQPRRPTPTPMSTKHYNPEDKHQ
jgi:hypothetical protein